VGKKEARDAGVALVSAYVADDPSVAQELELPLEPPESPGGGGATAHWITKNIAAARMVVVCIGRGVPTLAARALREENATATLKI
jgi:hypothetical protein